MSSLSFQVVKSNKLENEENQNNLIELWHQNSRLETFGPYRTLEFAEFDMQSEQVHVKSISEARRKIKLLRDDGLHKLQVFSDFDQTISCFYKNGKRCLASFEIFRNDHNVSLQFKKTHSELFNKYYPIEQSSHIDVNEKMQILEQWHKESQQAFINEGFTRQQCNQILNDCHLSLRCGFDDFFRLCNTYNVPFIMVSAGIQQVYTSALERIVKLNEYQAFHSFSNTIIFRPPSQIQSSESQQQQCSDQAHEPFSSNSSSSSSLDNNNNNNNKFQEQYLNAVIAELQQKVCSTNKEHVLRESGLSFLKNGILLGDSLSDVYIPKFTECQDILKIGFYNPNGRNEEDLHKYMDKFDIVLSGDPSFMFVIKLFHTILDYNGHEMRIRDTFWKTIKLKSIYSQLFDDL